MNLESYLITWTTGTMGAPKGVMIPLKAVEARIESLYSYYKEKDLLKYFTSMHSGLPDGQSGRVITAGLFCKFKGVDYVKDPTEASILMMTPHQLKKLIIKETELPNLNLIITNGMLLTEEDRFAIEEYYKKPVINMYGASEVGAVSMNGELLPGFEIDIRSNRLFIKSDTIATEYTTKEKFPCVNGWFKTPDQATFINNKLQIIGRLK